MWRIFDIKTDVSVKMLIIRGAWLVKIVTM